MLTVTIYSFGFRKSGIPKDSTENGGGFVFDCRCLPNPGREKHYQQQTGRDTEVQEYLQKFPEVEEFAQECFQLVNRAVENYTQRNFTHLMVSFGCTGGQHRSVYQAEKLFTQLQSIPHLQVELFHTEIQN